MTLEAASPWNPLPSLPRGSASFAHGVVGERILVAGGTDWEKGAKHTRGTVFALDVGATRWRELAALPRPFSSGAFGAGADGLYLFGGDDGARTGALAMRIDRNGRQYPAGELPLPLSFAGAVRVGSSVFILGGTHDVRDLTQITAEFLSFDLQSGAVTRLPEFPAGPIIHPALAIVDRRIFVFPGGAYDSATKKALTTRRTFYFDLDAQRWTELAPYPFAVRGIGAWPVDDHRVLLVGGYKARGSDLSDGAMTNECFLYDVGAQQYRVLPPLPTAAFLSASAGCAMTSTPSAARIARNIAAAPRIARGLSI